MPQRKLSKDIQLVFYSLAVENIYGRKPEQVGWWYLHKNRKVMVQISQENIEITKDRIGNITTSIGNAEFHPEQVWKCRNCDYRLVIQQDNNVNDYVFFKL